MAWVGEAGLGYGVVLGRCLLVWGSGRERGEYLGEERELDGVADVGLYVVG